MPKRSKAIKATDLKGDKPWLKKVGIGKYSIETKDKNKTFLIVCEGQTEEQYFKSFPVLTAIVKPVPLGCSKSVLVECASEMAKSEIYDEIWCVFDMDYKPDENGCHEDFNNAIKIATSLGFKCAYSNDAFELWFILHYLYIDQEQLRTFFYKKLSSYFSLNYEKDGKALAFSSKIYSILEKDNKASQKKATSNAKKLWESQKHKSYHLQNPVTTVFHLVEALNIHLRP